MDLEGIRQKILLATLERVPVRGWTSAALKAGAVDAGYDAAMALNAFPGAMVELAEYFNACADRRMIDGAARGVGLQVALGDIGRVLGIVDQHVVPGLVLGRLAARHGVIPLVGTLKGGIDVDDDAPVIEQLVVDQLADPEMGTDGSRHMVAPKVPVMAFTQPGVIVR